MIKANAILMGTKAVVVGRGGDTSADEIGMVVDGLDDGRAERQEAEVSNGVISWVEEVDAIVSGEGPIVVFARAVDPAKRFLVEETLESVAVRHFAKNGHEEHVVVARGVGLLTSRRRFVFATSSNTGAISYWPGATSLWRVFMGTPSSHIAFSTS